MEIQTGVERLLFRTAAFGGTAGIHEGGTGLSLMAM